MKTRLLRKTDLIMIFVIIFAGVAAILVNRYSGDSLIAQITVDGNVIETIDLNSVENTRTVITKTSPKTEITVEKGAIYFCKADCDNQLCVKSGKLTSGGATAVCLPAKVVITVTEAQSVDAVTY
ncbi:MAG: NusG domain II-containing protein [Clostridia bacterium]|nr:NusG domain II-containing protein [Clostridia bacterium]